MELKQGYKQTEVGVIPEDWRISTLGATCSFENGDRGINYPSPGSFVSDGIPFINAGHISFGRINLHEMDFITSEKFTRLSGGKVRPGDILFCLRGTLGKYGVVGSEFGDGAIASSLVIVRPNGISVIRQFLDCYFASAYCSQMIEKWAGGAAQPNLGVQDLARFTISLPPIAEQHAIAEALSDADALIEGLEGLIAKKRQLKHGAMQELLHPKDGWMEQSLWELADGRKELFDDGDWIESEHITDEGVRFVQTGNIGIGQFVEKDPKKYIFESSFLSLRCKEVLEGDLLICRLAEPAGRACVLPNIEENKVVTSVDVTIFRPPASIANKVFLANLFSTSQWFQTVSEKSGGTTHKRIARGALGRIKIKVPTLSEQTAIATILSDMDAEIAASKAKLDKARQVKQGMMQDLLTGRVRLV